VLDKTDVFTNNSLLASQIKLVWTYSWRIQSLPGNRILWRTISPMMQPTDQISTAGTYRSRKESKGKKKRGWR